MTNVRELVPFDQQLYQIRLGKLAAYVRRNVFLEDKSRLHTV